MSGTESEFDLLSDYERAICYFTLPKIHRSLPVPFYAVYSVAIIALIGLTSWGGVSGHRAALVGGGTVLAMTIIGGMGFLFWRSLTTQIREREALADAVGIPNAESGFEESMNPFARHTLVVRPRDKSGDAVLMRDRKGVTLFTAALDADKRLWSVGSDGPIETFDVRMEGRGGSFAVDTGAPGKAEALRGEHVVARVTRDSAWGRTRIDAALVGMGERNYRMFDGAVHYGGAIVGRVYYMRRSAYLDIESEHLNEATLTYFLTMT